MIINEQVKTKIKELALKSPNREICGLVLGSDIVFPCKNDSLVNDSFTLNPSDYLRGSYTGNVVACYHSHISSENASIKDRENCEGFQIPFVIYAIPQDKFVILTPLNYNNKYCGTEFVYGSSDCYGLVRKYYAEECGWYLTDYPRQEGWTKEKPDYFNQFFHQEGFYRVLDEPIKPEDLQIHDALLFKFALKNYPSHIGIYLGQNKFLHHPRNKQSCVDELTEPYLKRLTYVLRHKTLC